MVGMETSLVDSDEGTMVSLFDDRGCFHETFKMESKVEQKEESALARAAVRKGVAELVLKQCLNEDALLKTSGAMMCGMPSNLIKDALIIGNTRVFPNAVSATISMVTLWQNSCQGGLMLEALMPIMAMEVCLCCS